MARPRSEDKQLALLDAATEIVAAQGLAAPTAQIAKRAGVAEGTLFRYFATKDALLNALYLYQSRRASEATNTAWDERLPMETRMLRMWEAWIDWGVANPAAFSAIAQLEVSDKLTDAARAEAWGLCECAQQSLHGMQFPGMDQPSSLAFFNALSTGIAQATINYLLQHPEHSEACKRASFALGWPLLQQS